MKLFLKIAKWLAVLLVSLILIGVGGFISLSLFPLTERVSSNACVIVGYETVFCQKAEDASFYYWRVVGAKDGEVVQIERKIPKLQVGRLDL